MKEKVSLPVAAGILNTTPLNVLMHVKRGLLAGVEEAEGWMIDRASLEVLIARTGGKAADVCASGCARKHACGGGCG